MENNNEDYKKIIKQAEKSLKVIFYAYGFLSLSFLSLIILSIINPAIHVRETLLLVIIFVYSFTDFLDVRNQYESFKKKKVKLMKLLEDETNKKNDNV